MSKFNTSKNKLRTLWEQVQKNNGDLRNKDNADKFGFFTNLSKQQNIKVPIELFDINLTLISSSERSTAFKSEKMPSLVSYSADLDINLPEIFLPFVEYSIEITSVPDTEVHGVFEFDPSTWVGDDMEVKGDGILIYKGQPIVRSSFNSFFITHTTAFLLSKGISLSLTKETWLAELDFFEEFQPPSGASGKVMGLTGVEIINENSCLSNDDTKVFAINHFSNKNHKIISLDSDGFTGIGTETITTFIDNGEGGCDTVTVQNENVTRTIDFLTIDDYTVQLAETTQIGIGYSKNRIESKKFTKEDRWLFYSTELQKIFETTIIDSNDGDFQEIELSNLPNTGDGDILPYASITLKRNVEFINPAPVRRRQSEGSGGLANAIISGSPTSIADSGREYKNYIKISPSDATIPTYRFKLAGSFLIVSPSIQKLLVTRNKADITTQKFKSIGINKFNALIDKELSTFISGIVENIFHREERLSGSIITEFFTDPVNNSSHGILSLSSTSYTAVGDETVTIIPIEGETIITKRNNIIATKVFADAVTYSIGIEDTVDFPVYDDIYSIVDTTYDLTTENHSILSKQLFTPETQDTIVNIKAHLVNPLYWREQRRYDKNDL